MALFCLEEDAASFEFEADFAPAPLAELGHEAQEELWAALALRNTPGLGARTQARLLKAYHSAREAVENADDWPRQNVPLARAQAFKSNGWRKNAEREWRMAREQGVKILLWQSATYPICLRQLPDAPSLLYLRGDASLLAAPGIAIVGSRAPTQYGRDVARAFGEALAKAGIAVVSGMAMGIDRQAHLGALAGIGKSIGVLGTGIDIAYPRSNSDVYDAMRKGGLLVSEFAPGTAPSASNFPIRNRIISGLSLGTVVVEAAARSGSLVTARLALEQNREVFAVPGQAMSANSVGCQNLIRQGARAVFYPEDILRDLSHLLTPFGMPAPLPTAAPARQEPKPPRPAAAQAPLLPPPRPTISDPEAEQAGQNLLAGDSASRILEVIRNAGTMQLDALARAANMSVGELNIILLGLEMTGKVKRRAGARFEIA